MNRFGFAVATLAMAACSQTAKNSTPSRGLSEALAYAGFSEMALPSTAYAPGSVVTSVRGFHFQTPLRLAYICDPQFTTPITPQIDTAASQQLSSSLGGGVELSGGGLAALGLGASANALNSVTLEFRNVRVEQLSFQSLDAIVEELGPQCKRSLENFKRQGIAKQTQQALRADVTYKADFKAGASAEVKNAVIQSLAAGFGASVERQSNSIIEGTELYYGVILRDL